MNIHAYLVAYSFIFLSLFSIMSVKGAKSIKLSFFDLTPSVVINESKHENIKQ